MLKIKNYRGLIFLFFSLSVMVKFSLATEGIILEKVQSISKAVPDVKVDQKVKINPVSLIMPEIKPSQQTVPKIKLNLPNRIIMVDKLNYKVGETIRLNINNNLSDLLNNVKFKLEVKNNVDQDLTLEKLIKINDFQDLDFSSKYFFQNLNFNLF